MCEREKWKPLASGGQSSPKLTPILSGSSPCARRRNLNLDILRGIKCQTAPTSHVRKITSRPGINILMARHTRKYQESFFVSLVWLDLGLTQNSFFYDDCDIFDNASFHEERLVWEWFMCYTENQTPEISVLLIEFYDCYLMNLAVFPCFLISQRRTLLS